MQARDLSIRFIARLHRIGSSFILVFYLVVRACRFSFWRCDLLSSAISLPVTRFLQAIFCVCEGVKTRLRSRKIWKIRFIPAVSRACFHEIIFLFYPVSGGWQGFASSLFILFFTPETFMLAPIEMVDGSAGRRRKGALHNAPEQISEGCSETNHPASGHDAVFCHFPGQQELSPETTRGKPFIPGR